MEPRSLGPRSNDTAHANDTPPLASHRRLLAFAAVLLASVAAAAGYAGFVAWRADAVATAAAAAAKPIAVVKLGALPAGEAFSVAPVEPAASTVPEGTASTAIISKAARPERPSKPTATAAATDERGPARRPYVLFRSTAPGESFGHVSVQHLDAIGGERLVTPLECDRVHFAAERGICLGAKRGVVTTYQAHIFDRDFSIKHTHPLAGPPSRARMSPDGRYAAVTVFVSGHSYSNPGFTTRTSIFDAVSGQVVVDDLEHLQVMRGPERIKASDFNFWGVTFAGKSGRFYATLATAGTRLLVEGDLGARQLRVVHEDVECPSLSPDNTKVAFKRRIPVGTTGRFVWRLQILELASGKETALPAESRSVDDQVEWLGNQEIVYAMPEDALAATAATNSWALRIDGTGAPRLLVPLAFSPTVLR